MPRIRIFVALMFVVTGLGCGSGNNLSSDIKQVVDAERRFAKDAAERGIKEAFLAHLAEDAVLFRPHPVNGREWLREQPSTDAFLGWEPVIADVSDAGDLGYTTGPWWFSAEGAGVEPNVFGHYVSVWKKTPAGKWQVAIDVGTTHDNPTGPAPHLIVPKRDRRRDGWEDKGPAEVKFEDLRQVEDEFTEMCRSDGMAVAYANFAGDDVRFCPPDDFPLSGRKPVLMQLEKMDHRRIHSPVGGEVSRSGDLGYVYGTGRIIDEDTGEEIPSFCYLRIWTRGRDKRWEMALDVSELISSAGVSPDDAE
ncbi:MAG: nuclear transport factor 2 family protein [Candidatus Latescibacterota bacterium]|nr:MAG: nuclear transport factor 2 family protein [Candidatus Latescibacterota bacterium]